MAGCISGAVLRYLGSSWLRNCYGSVLGGLNVPFSQVHGQWARLRKLKLFTRRDEGSTSRFLRHLLSSPPGTFLLVVG